MNDGHGNGTDPSVNGRPYYSADNGFACAAAGRSVTEALQEYLNVIVRNEELEIERSHSQIQADIKALVEDKERLEQRKLDLQDHIQTLTEKNSVNEVKISESTTELEAPIKDDPPPPDPRIDTLKTAIDEKALALEEKQIASIKIKTDLGAPTAVELEPLTIDQSSVLRFSALEKGFAVLTAFVLVGLIGYLFIFYASVGDRTFTAGIGTVNEKRHIIIPRALAEAWNPSPADPQSSNPEDLRKNWFVLTFPFIFLTLAFIFYWFEMYSKSKRKWDMWGVLAATFFIDLIIAIKISKQMHRFIKGDEIEYLYRDNLLEILSVILLGFGVSVLLSLGISWVMKVWNQGKPSPDGPEQLERLKRVEQNDRLIELAALTEEILYLQNRIDDLKQERENCERDEEERLDTLIKSHKHPIHVELARLNAEKEILQNQITELNEQVESIQKEINQCESEIEDLLKDQRKKVIDVKKLEAQAHEFVSGWCRYVAQSKTELPADVATQIKDIQHLADETLETYKQSLATV